MSSRRADKKTTTLNDIYDLYILTVNKRSTVSNYKNIYDNQLKPQFGEMLVVKITTVKINKYLLSLLKKYEASYVITIKTILLALLNYAYKEKIISEKITNVIKIKVPKSKIDIFTNEEQSRLIEYCLNNLNYVTLCILIALNTGIRIGELCALRLCDIEFIPITNNALLNINKTMQRIKNLENNATTKTKIIIESPKSNDSVRGVPIPNFLIFRIKELYKNCAYEAYILTGSKRRFIEPRTLNAKYKKILKECNIQYRKFHTLRHTFATNCITRNYYDLETLSTILGHSNSVITSKVYIHITNEIKFLQVKNIENDINNKHFYRCKELKEAL